jgi:hypothetical protein
MRVLLTVAARRHICSTLRILLFLIAPQSTFPRMSWRAARVSNQC